MGSIDIHPVPTFLKGCSLVACVVQLDACSTRVPMVRPSPGEHTLGTICLIGGEKKRKKGLATVDTTRAPSRAEKLDTCFV